MRNLMIGAFCSLLILSSCEKELIVQNSSNRPNYSIGGQDGDKIWNGKGCTREFKNLPSDPPGTLKDCYRHLDGGCLPDIILVGMNQTSDDGGHLSNLKNIIIEENSNDLIQFFGVSDNWSGLFPDLVNKPTIINQILIGDATISMIEGSSNSGVDKFYFHVDSIDILMSTSGAEIDNYIDSGELSEVYSIYSSSGIIDNHLTLRDIILQNDSLGYTSYFSNSLNYSNIFPDLVNENSLINGLINNSLKFIYQNEVNSNKSLFILVSSEVNEIDLDVSNTIGIFTIYE